MRCLLTGVVRVQWVLLLMGVFPAPVLAGNEDFTSAIQKIEKERRSNHYDSALSLVSVDLEKFSATEEQAILYLYRGILQDEIHHKKEAEAALRIAFALDPGAPLPEFEHLPSQIKELANTIRQKVKQEKVEIAKKEQAQKGGAEKEQKKQERDAEVVSQEVESQKKKELATGPAPLPPASLQHTSSPRRYALVPALAGGALAVAGGISWGISRWEASKLINGDSSLKSEADVSRISTSGHNWQLAGATLLGVGVAGLAASASMYLMGGPEEKRTALVLSTDGTSAFVFGRWP